MTRRQAILEALKALVAGIRRANGYATDAGACVVLGEVAALGPSDPAEAIALVASPDETVWQQGGKRYLKLPVEIRAIAKADLTEPWVAIEAVLEDVKRAVQDADRTLGGLVTPRIERGASRTLPREPGATTVGTGVLYLCPYQESWT